MRVPRESDGRKVIIWTREAILGIVTEEFYQITFLGDILRNMTFEELISIREKPEEIVKPIGTWYPKEDPTPHVDFGTDEELSSSEEESDEDWPSNLEEMKQLAHKTNKG